MAGSEEYWSNTQPGMVWKKLIQGTHANPIFVLDEIDKVTDRWGDPLGALYQLLESRTASTFTDKSIPWIPIDASRCNWIATANDIEAIHPALRSRFTEVAVTCPTEDALIALVQRLYGALLEEFQLSGRPPALRDRGTGSGIRSAGCSIRDAKRILRSATIARALRHGRPAIDLEASAKPMTGPRMGFIH